MHDEEIDDISLAIKKEDSRAVFCPRYSVS